MQLYQNELQNTQMHNSNSKRHNCYRTKRFHNYSLTSQVTYEYRTNSILIKTQGAAGAETLTKTLSAGGTQCVR